MDPNQPEHVRAALQRILDFKDMKSSTQLSRFLEFVVEESLAGRESRIKERTIAIGALERDEDFDPRFDAIVRIVAGKLRRTLDRYYQSDGASDELRITIPKGGYVPRVLTREEAMWTAPAADQPVAVDPILRTKLYRPPVTPDLVRLPALLERLNRYRSLPLILVSAPAGYGKTTLLSEWLDECDVIGAWLSLDKDDNDPRRFVSGVVATLQTIRPTVAQSLQDLIKTPQLPSIRHLSHQLLNDVAAIDEPFVLVLDDYHLIHDRAIHEFVVELLEHPLRQMQIVILTRTEPPLSLDRLRARGAVVELSIFDLRFTPAETAEFLAKTLAMSLTDEVAQAVSVRMEGWPAGLRLLVHSLRHHEDPEAALSRLEGDLSAVTGYLVSEILSRLPSAMSMCVLKLSIVSRFCESLSEALCDERYESATRECGGARLTHWLHEHNLFVISLDAENRWYRFHHLFRDLLLRQLKEQLNGREVAELHARASKWFESHSLITEAIDHRVKAEDAVGAAEVVERHRQNELDEDRWFVLRRWINLLPENIPHQRIALLLTQGWIAYFNFHMERLPEIVQRINSLPDQSSSDPVELAEVEFFRSVIFYWQGKIDESRACCENALAVFPDRQHMVAGELRVYMGLSLQATGASAQAAAFVEREHQALGSADNDLFRTRVVAAQAFVHLIQGGLPPAVRAARELVAVAQRGRFAYALAWGSYAEALGSFHAHRLDDALRGFAAASERRLLVETRLAVDSLAGLALSHRLLQRPDLAANVVEELIAFARDTGERQPMAIAESCRARLSVLDGDLESAVEWARSVDVQVHAPSMFFWLEDPWITRARVWIAEGTAESVGTALEALSGLRPQIEALHSTCQMIEILVLQSLGLEKQGDSNEALSVLDHAISMAEPGGWIRPFVEAGPPMIDLLIRWLEQNAGDGFARRLLALCNPGSAVAHGTTDVGERCGDVP